MKRLIFGMLGVFALWILPGSAGQGTVQNTVFPYGLESQNGNTVENFLQFPAERQFWFRGTYLAQRWTTPVEISAVSFRVEEQLFRVDYEATIPRVELWLSTTSREAANLSENLPSNQGGDARLVLASDNVFLTSLGGPGPNAFGLRLDFQQPFVFNPESGNLLMWIRTSGGAFEPIPWQTDAYGFPTFEESPFGVIGGPFSTPRPRGPVVQFTWTAVPEPCCTLLFFASFAYLIRRRRQNK